MEMGSEKPIGKIEPEGEVYVYRGNINLSELPQPVSHWTKG
jgi:hypothetical protein